MSFQFNANWFPIFFAFLLLWIVLLVSRKRHNWRREVKIQFCLGFCGVFVAFLMEISAISLNLWSYVPVNWPIILWPTYFVAFLFGYQMLKFIETLFSRIYPL